MHLLFLKETQALLWLFPNLFNLLPLSTCLFPENLKISSSLASKEASKIGGSNHISESAQIFTFRELAAATRNFRAECFLGEGGFGRVYKGRLEGTDQVS